MNPAAVTIALPTANLRRAFEFYRKGLGLELVAATSGDEMPEPVRFKLTDGAHLMLAPSAGFARVLGANQVAPTGLSECVLGWTVPTLAEVDAVVARARAAGANAVVAPAAQPWGYAGSFQDPDGHVWMVAMG